MSKASVVVDKSTGEGGSAATEVFDFTSLEEAQQKSGALGSEWTDEGWTKRHEVWVRGSEWRQKIIVVGGAR